MVRNIDDARRTRPERIPPHNLEAEESVLGAMMLSPDAIADVIEHLKPEDFYTPANARIYGSIQQMYAHSLPVDAVTVVEELKRRSLLPEVGGHLYVFDLVDRVPDPRNAGQYARIISQNALLRRLIDAAAEIMRTAYAVPEDPENAADQAEALIYSVARRDEREETVALRPIVDQALEDVEHSYRRESSLAGLPTHFTDLDEKLSGLQQNNLIILAARPSVGKSALAINIARNVSIESVRPVLFFSVEMSRWEVGMRMLCTEAGVPMARVRAGRVANEQFRLFVEAAERLHDAPLHVVDSGHLTLLDVRAKTRRLRSRLGDLGLIVVDYLQLMSHHGRVESRQQEIAEISRGLKMLAKELEVPVLALSQLNREPEKRADGRPQLADLRESGCLAYDTQIMRADTGELAPIGGLVGRRDVPVYTLTDDWRITIGTMSSVFSSGRKRVYRLQTRSGRAIKASPNHPFRTVGGWKRLDELRIGEHLAMPREVAPVEPSGLLADDELVLLAHLIGDGCVLPRQPIHYTSADPLNLSTVAGTAERLFGIRPRIVRQENWWHVYLPSPYRLARGRRHPITMWFEDLGLERVRSYEKKVPPAVFTCGWRQIQLFLRHLWATNGNIAWKRLPGRKPAASIYYATTSRILAQQVQHLLLRLGIQSTVRVVPERRHRPGHTVHVEGSVQQKRFLELVSAHGERGALVEDLAAALDAITPNPNVDIIPREAWPLAIAPAKEAVGLSWREVSARIQTAYCGSGLFKSGLSRERMARVATALRSEPLGQPAASDVMWDEIVSIIPLGVEEVFDATVPGTHNFLANDFIVHNSLEQDADVVMFIHREKNTEGQWTKGVAEVIIAKHRNGPTGKVELAFNDELIQFRNLFRGQSPS